MPFISYAQNYEDVMLFRALKNIENGFYIDVGANDPVRDSVTKAFYERGWRGINIEPIRHWCDKLIVDRPEDLNINAAISDQPGILRIYDVQGTGLSTSNKDFAENHSKELGFQFQEIIVPALTLDSVLQGFNREIHFLKVDVEGAEKEVLASIDLTRTRPWIILVEATKPFSQVQNYEEWETLLIDRAYTFVYFDGLNRFYVSADKNDLMPAFGSPPNVFDDFIQFKHWNTQTTLNIKEAEVQAVAADRDRIQGELQAVTRERESLRTDMEAMRMDMETMRTDMETMRTDMETMRTDMEAMRTDRDRIRTQAQAMARERETLHADREALRFALAQVYQSHSWRVTRPLRMATDFARAIKRKLFQTVFGRDVLLSRLGYEFFRYLFKFILLHPRLRKFIGAFLAIFPGLTARLKQTESYKTADLQAKTLQASVQDSTLDENSQYQPTQPVFFPLSKGQRTIYFYVDHTVQCPSNTGMQQVTRRLGRALLETGEKICFVKWDAPQHRFILLNQAELAYLSQWHGPVLSPQDLEQYPKSNDNSVPVDKHNLDEGHWLVVPEVTHITYQDHPMTLDVLVEAKHQGLKTAFIYYDATPLRRADLNGMALSHETYMQQLLLSDLVVPISNWSTRELVSFFQVHEGAALTSIPRISALPLPGESQLASRVTTPPALNGTSNLILSVGSIVHHKNQVTLVHAFERYCEAYPETNWQLLLVGNLHPDLADEIKRATEKNPRIKQLGYVSNDMLDELYRSCSFTVFPSVSEGFGLPISESLWYAKPCICANFGAMGEAAQGGGCLAIDTRNADELLHAIIRMTTEPRLLERLSLEACARPIPVWTDYAQQFAQLLDKASDPIKQQMGIIYYWVDQTVTFPRNTGIQRVVRGLGRALQENGFKVIPVKWDKVCNQLYSPSEEELLNLSSWNGPQPSGWSPWIDPAQATANDWLLIPELVNDPAVGLTAVKQYASRNNLRCAWIFFDAIPWKRKTDYTGPMPDFHQQYMKNLNQFELILPISHFSRTDLISFLAALPQKTPNLENRIQACVLPGEFLESERSTNVKEKDSGTIKILCVGTIEPRKNHLVLLEAFSQMRTKARRSVELILVGDNPYPGLATQVEHYINTHPGIYWEKDPSDSTLRALYDTCDFTVYPSLEEGFGLPILESLWHARPCICRNSGAMLEVAQGGGCLTVETADPNALAKGVLELVKNDVLRQKLAQEAISRPYKTWRDYAREVVTRMAVERHLPLPQTLPTPIDRNDFYNQYVNLHSRPLLSICITTYNRAEWLAVSLKNLTRLLPTPSADIEIVVCDNTSPDHTADVVQPYLQRADFRYYRNPENVGMLGNLRVTAHHARGRYIWILGDDDLVKPGSIEKVLQVIKTNPEVALIYLNYAYSREDDAKSVLDLDAFLNDSTPIAPAGKDIIGPVRQICAESENFFTAIYCLVYRRDHALRAYTQDTEGRPFSTMLTCIPTTYYTLNFMMNEPAYWVGEPQLVVNLNVSWMKYAPLWILERIPEVYDLAERLGADPQSVDRWRKHTLPGVVHWFRKIYEHDPEGNMAYFSPSRIVARMKHLDSFPDHVQELRKIYEIAHAARHPGAKVLPAQVFSSVASES